VRAASSRASSEAPRACSAAAAIADTVHSRSRAGGRVVAGTVRHGHGASRTGLGRMPRQELRRDHGCEARRCRKLQARRREAAVCCERPTRSVHSQNSEASKPGCVQAAAAQVTTAMGARCTLIGMAASVRCRCCRAGPARSVGTGDGRTRDLSGEADRPDGAGLVGGSGEVVCKDRRPVRWRRRAAGRCLRVCHIAHRY
jgi:hypothetical protein